MNRRSALTLLFTLLLPATLRAQPVGPAAQIALLRELVETLGAAGDALKKLTDGIAHLVTTSAAGYNYVAAERERQRLIDISRRTAILITEQRIRVVESLDEYLDTPVPRDADWQRVVRRLGETLTTVRALLKDVQDENSDFVLEPAYRRLNETLAARRTLLERLAQLPAPSSPEEREALRAASVRYRELIANADEAVTALNAYLQNRR